MKKYILIGCALSALLFAACSGKSKTGSDSARFDSGTSAIELPDSIVPEIEYFLTADSIGPVHVGEKISDLPATVPGLYDMMVTTETPDAMAYTFLLADNPQFTIYDFMAGEVDVIALEGSARACNSPDGPLRVGDPFIKVLKLKGVESQWVGIEDDDGIWYWKWNGLYFAVDEMNISAELTNALCEGRRPPRGALFTPDVKIGYIATGLPF